MRRARGFTLLELMVAVAILAIMGVMAHQGLGAMARNAAASAEASERFSELIFTMALLERDLRSAVPRGVRDVLGGEEPALLGQAETITLTRAGWDNPLRQDRSTLQRVSWTRRDGVLTRIAWPVLDRAQGTVPITQALLEDVNELSVEFLATRGEEWINIWPPPSAVERLTEPWPSGVRVSIDLPDLGRFERVFSLAGPAS